MMYVHNTTTKITDMCDSEPTESLCDQTLCSNGGSCYETNSSAFCECPACWTGELCTESIEECSTPSTCMPGMDNCGSVTLPTSSSCNVTKCMNGGTCIAVENIGEHCNCVAGYTGEMCETDLSLCPQDFCKNGGSCSTDNGKVAICHCQPQFTGNVCQTPVCVAEANVPVYPGSTVTYSWPATEAGSSVTQPCPKVCQEIINYPPGSVVERVCGRESAQWLETRIARCGLSITALQLCEAMQVSVYPQCSCLFQVCICLLLKVGNSLERANAVDNITSHASALESLTIALTSHIIASLTETAIVDTQV